MKATFYFPAHPSYFGGKYSQDEIDAALKIMDEQRDGMFTKGIPRAGVSIEFVLLRQPGREPDVVIYSAGMGNGQPVSDRDKSIGLDQYRRTSHKELQGYITSFTCIMDCMRAGPDTENPKPRW